jgi:hypothetical protein
LKNYTPGWANVEALREITRLADEALSASNHDAYVSEKVTSIKSFAEVLYSTRKHQKYTRGSLSGADFVRSMIHEDAYLLTQWSPNTPESNRSKHASPLSR